MSDLVGVAGDLLTCPLCNKRMHQPVLLSCLHSACYSCLQQYLHNNDPTYKCMVCHSECITAPNNGHNTVANNYFLASVCELSNCHTSSIKPCDYCTYDDQREDANWRCIQCADNLCDTCATAHRRTKLTRSHSVLSLDEIRAGSHDESIRENQQVKCSKHEGEALKYLCSREDLLICRECKVSEHDKHPCEEINEAAAHYRSSAQGLLNKVDAMIPNMVEYGLFLKDYIGHLCETKDKLTADIESQAELMHKMIDEHKTSMIDNLEESVQQEHKVTEERTGKIDDMISILKSTTDFVGKLLSYGKSDEMLSIRKEVSARLIELGHYKIEPMANKLSLYYSPGTATQGNLETLIGKVDVFKVPLNDTGVKTIFKNDSVSFQEQQSTIIQTIAEEAEQLLCFESNGASDTKDIWPTGVDVDCDGNIIVLDRDNKKVKVFNRSGKFIREFGQNGVQNLQCPYDLTIMMDGSIAVTDYEDEDIKIFTRLGMFVKSIKADFKYPRGITATRTGELIVVDCHSHQLTIHDPDTGKVIREIKGKTNSTGFDINGFDTVLTDPYYVTTDRSASGNIIVTDWSSPNIKFFDSQGYFLTKYATYGIKQDQVLQPYGVCVDKYGNIFVADNQNHRIHLLAPDASFVKFLVTKQHGLWHPMAVAIDLCGNLVVTEALGKVKVFKYL